MPHMQLYLKDDDREKMKRLAGKLEDHGVNLRDQRGNVSFSKMVRYLVEKELDGLERDPQKK